jgi:hypothetical protein
MRTAGVLYFVTHVTSVAALVLYGPVLQDATKGSDAAILVAGLLEVILALAVVGTAVALYPAVSRFSPAGAIGYTALRTLEAATILAGVVSVLAVVTLRDVRRLRAGVRLHRRGRRAGVRVGDQPRRVPDPAGTQDGTDSDRLGSFQFGRGKWQV